MIDLNLEVCSLHVKLLDVYILNKRQASLVF